MRIPDRLPTSRRRFVKIGAMIASAGFLHSTSSASVGAADSSSNGQIETAVIGTGERGKYLIANLPAAFRVTALCDCSLQQIESVKRPPARFSDLLSQFVEGDLRSCQIYQDYRQMLEVKKFDAVIVTTADHHHALAAILALQAGAHVYVEKPLAVTIAEGRAIVRAANKYQRVVQVGSQQRSMEVNRRACEFVRSGGLGKIQWVEERNYPGPMPYAEASLPRETVPSSLDWNLFCGPTPLRPYNKRLWVKDAFDVGYLRWRGWDLFEDYSGHLMTNWGAHSIDMIQYALGMDRTGPIRLELRPDEIDDFVDDQWHQKTPPLGALRDRTRDRARFCPLVMEYADGTRVHFKPGTRKTVFHGEKGSLTVSRNDYRAEPAELLPPPVQDEQDKWKGSGHVARPHLQNWLDAIQSDGKLNAPVEIGHRTATVCHLANLARQLGRSLDWDPDREQFVGDAEANLQLDRSRRRGFELPTV